MGKRELFPSGVRIRECSWSEHICSYHMGGELWDFCHIGPEVKYNLFF